MENEIEIRKEVTRGVTRAGIEILSWESLRAALLVSVYCPIAGKKSLICISTDGHFLITDMDSEVLHKGFLWERRHYAMIADIIEMVFRDDEANYNTPGEIDTDWPKLLAVLKAKGIKIDLDDPGEDPGDAAEDPAEHQDVSMILNEGGKDHPIKRKKER